MKYLILIMIFLTGCTVASVSRTVPENIDQSSISSDGMMDCHGKYISVRWPWEDSKKSIGFSGVCGASGKGQSEITSKLEEAALAAENTAKTLRSIILR